MGRKLTLSLVVGIALVLGVAAIAAAYGTPYVSCPLSTTGAGSNCEFPVLRAVFGVGIVPKKLPKHELAPVAIELRGKVSTTDGTHPSALREVTIDLDRNIVIDATGLPVCRAGGRDVSIRKACRSSIVGSGKADFELAFPEAPPIRSQSKLTAYNTGVKAGAITLVVVGSIDVPAPRTIAIPVEIDRVHTGRYGLRAVAKVPVVAGGSGSLIDFNLQIKRLFDHRGSRMSYAMARCPNRQLETEVSTLLRNEAHEPGVAATTVIKGTLASPCTPSS